jgi:hypothetical protein
MKKILIYLLVSTLFSCRKCTPVPTYRFTAEQKEWFIYQVGDTLKYSDSSYSIVVSKILSEKEGGKDIFQNRLPNYEMMEYKFRVFGTSKLPEGISFILWNEGKLQINSDYFFLNELNFSNPKDTLIRGKLFKNVFFLKDKEIYYSTLVSNNILKTYFSKEKGYVGYTGIDGKDVILDTIVRRQ